jgi:hypothetical protein
MKGKELKEKETDRREEQEKEQGVEIHKLPPAGEFDLIK